MEHPSNDLEDRMPIWDAMQFFWMDIDPKTFLKQTAELCSKSKYSLDELTLIYWNEVKPAVAASTWIATAPEWTGFQGSYLFECILTKHRYGKRLPAFWLHRYSNTYWEVLKNAIVDYEKEHLKGGLT